MSTVHLGNVLDVLVTFLVGVMFSFFLQAQLMKRSVATNREEANIELNLSLSQDSSNKINPARLRFLENRPRYT
jgi:hypothetical protein